MESSRRSDNIVYIGGKSLVLVVCTPFSFKGSRSHLLARFFCKINIWVDKEEKYGSLKTTNFREKSPKTLSTWVFFGWKDTRLLCNWSTRALDKSPWSYGRGFPGPSNKEHSSRWAGWLGWAVLYFKENINALKHIEKWGSCTYLWGTAPQNIVTGFCIQDLGYFW